MKIIFTIILFFTLSCQKSTEDWINRDLHQGLYNLEYDTSFEVYSTDKNPTQINNAIMNLDEAKQYLDTVFDEELTFAVLFIDAKNWDTYAFAPPPGMPQAYYDGNMILGLEKSVIGTMNAQALAYLPDSTLNELRLHYGDDIDLDLFFRDALAIHELGHLYQFYRLGGNSQRRWLDELFGNLVLVAVANNLNSPDTFNRIDSYQMALINHNLWGHIVYTSLQDFEENYFQIMQTGQNYGWYQAQFYLKSKELYSTFGDDFLLKFRQLLIDTNPESIGKVNDEELYNLIADAFGQEVLDVLRWDVNLQSENP